MQDTDRHWLLVGWFALAVVLALSQMAAAQGTINCNETTDIRGLSALIGTSWVYLTKGITRLVAVVLVVWGGWETVFARNVGAGIISGVVGLIVGFAPSIVDAIIKTGGAAGTVATNICN